MRRFVIPLIIVFVCAAGVYAQTVTLSMANRVKINTQAPVTATVNPPGTYTYQWSADIGNISGSGASATYTAPASKGRATISVTVLNGGNPVCTGTIKTLVFKKIIVIKCDDLYYNGTPVIRDGWKSYFDYMVAQKMKFSAGAMTSTFVGAPSTFVNCIQGYLDSGYMEIWFHGVLHNCAPGEFAGPTVAQQTASFNLGINEVKTSINGYTMHGFGPSCATYDANTPIAMNAVPEMIYFFQGNIYPGYTAGFIYPQSIGTTCIQTEHFGVLHVFPTDFQTQYAQAANTEYSWTQMHPPWWQNTGPDYHDLTAWQGLVDFMKNDGASVIFPYDYAKMVQDPTYVAAEGPLTADMNPPTAGITFPANGATVLGTVTISGTAADDVGVSRVDFLVDGTVKGSDSASPYTYAWNTAVETNASHTLIARAYDASGNQGQNQRSVTVNNPPDTTAPTARILAPVDGATVTGIVTISGTAADNVGVSRVDFLVDGTVKGSDSSSPYLYAWNTATETKTSHALIARAYDYASNTAENQISVTVEGNIHDPLGAKVYPNPFVSGANMTFSINGTTGGSVDIYNISGKKVISIPIPSGVNSASWDLLNGKGKEVDNGLYISVIRDNAGNMKAGKLVIRK
jgi:hypothetical protein